MAKKTQTKKPIRVMRKPPTTKEQLDTDREQKEKAGNRITALIKGEIPAYDDHATYVVSKINKLAQAKVALTRALSQVEQKADQHRKQIADIEAQITGYTQDLCVIDPELSKIKAVNGRVGDQDA